MKTTIKNGILSVVIITICLFFGMLYFSISSGHSNLIYFDMEKQSIVRCKGIISNFYIISKDNKDCLHFSVLQGRKGSNIFSIKELNKNYSIEVTNSLIDIRRFKLRPETEYEIINHSNGDSANGKLVIRTDKNSSVIYADKLSCK